MNPQTILLIGIDAYECPDAHLRKAVALHGCVNDIDKIEALWLNKLGAYPSQIKKLCAPHPGHLRSTRIPEQYASAEAIRSAFETLARDAQAGDRIFIYYSGHGKRHDDYRTDQHREALVPADAFEKYAVIWDYEINAWLGQISTKGADLTAIFDCCHSSSVYRGGPYSKIRTFPEPLPCSPPQRRYRSLSSSSRSRDAADGDLPGIAGREAGASDPGFVAVAAAQTNQPAYEQTSRWNRPSGAFTSAFLNELSRREDTQLSTLCWKDIWPALGTLAASGNHQHPSFTGRLERRVFGGSWQMQDVGILLSKTQGHYKIHAGISAGFGVNAQVAVYGPQPAIFPLLHTEEEQGARLGTLRVISASWDECEAIAEGESFAWMEGVRARLISPGEGSELNVALMPHDKDLVEMLSGAAPFIRILEGRDAGDNELCIEKVGLSGLRFREASFDKLREDSTVPPLFETEAAEEARLVRLVLHYEHYNRLLRLARKLNGLHGGLKVHLLDASTLSSLPPSELQFPRLPELPRETKNPGTYLLGSGHPACFMVENKTPKPLYITLFNCAATGRIQILGGLGQYVMGWGKHVFWFRDHVGMPFRCSLPEGRSATLDRLIAVGTEKPSPNLACLELDYGFGDIYRTTYRTSREFSGACEAWNAPEAWTAALQPVKIIG